MTQKRNKLLTLKLEKAVEENYPSNQKTEEESKCDEKFDKPKKLTLSNTRFLSRTLSISTTMSSLGMYRIFFYCSLEFCSLEDILGTQRKRNMQ